MGVLFNVITFDSTHKAMKAEKHFAQIVPSELIPTPREISANCGLSLKFQDEALESVLSELKSHFSEVEGIKVYSIEKNDDVRMATEICWR